MPIPEAMNRGFILVEFTNTSVEADEMIRRGVVTVATSNEIITYNVQSVLDTKTGKELNMADAIAEGIVDIEHGKYLDRKTGETMSLSEAIDRG